MERPSASRRMGARRCSRQVDGVDGRSRGGASLQRAARYCLLITYSHPGRARPAGDDPGSMVGTALDKIGRKKRALSASRVESARLDSYCYSTLLPTTDSGSASPKGSLSGMTCELSIEARYTDTRSCCQGYELTGETDTDGGPCDNAAATDVTTGSRAGRRAPSGERPRSADEGRAGGRRQRVRRCARPARRWLRYWRRCAGCDGSSLPPRPAR